MSDDHSKDSNPFIDQIEQLQLPKRMEKRRKVYLGEKISCVLKYGDSSAVVEVIDLSLSGLALVETKGKIDFPCVVGQKLLLVFKNMSAGEFSVPAEVSNISQASLGGHAYERVGVRFSTEYCDNSEAFVAGLGSQLIESHAAVRPQAFFNDPFFFNEIVVFQVNGFTALGVDLSVSARCKTLLPKQRLDVDIYLPGRGRFLVSIENSVLHYKESADRYRIYGSFIKPEKKFLEAVSEYLVTFARDSSPNQLRSLGFSLGELDLAFEQSYAPVGDNFISDEGLRAGLLAPPLPELESKDAADKFTRPLTCKLGDKVVATAGLVFCLGDRQYSKLSLVGHQLSDQLISRQHMELTNLYVSPAANLVDFLLPLLRHCMRIGLQAQANVLLLECVGQVKPTLEKLGFRSEDSQKKRSRDGGEDLVLFLMSIDLKRVLLKQDKLVSEAVWKQVYGDLINSLRIKFGRKFRSKTNHKRDGKCCDLM